MALDPIPSFGAWNNFIEAEIEDKMGDSIPLLEADFEEIEKMPTNTSVLNNI